MAAAFALLFLCLFSSVCAIAEYHLVTTSFIGENDEKDIIQVNKLLQSRKHIGGRFYTTPCTWVVFRSQAVDIVNLDFKWQMMSQVANAGNCKLIRSDGTKHYPANIGELVWLVVNQTLQLHPNRSMIFLQSSNFITADPLPWLDRHNGNRDLSHKGEGGDRTEDDHGYDLRMHIPDKMNPMSCLLSVFVLPPLFGKYLTAAVNTQFDMEKFGDDQEAAEIPSKEHFCKTLLRIRDFTSHQKVIAETSTAQLKLPKLEVLDIPIELRYPVIHDDKQITILTNISICLCTSAAGIDFSITYENIGNNLPKGHVECLTQYKAPWKFINGEMQPSSFLNAIAQFSADIPSEDLCYAMLNHSIGFRVESERTIDIDGFLGAESILSHASTLQTYKNLFEDAGLTIPTSYSQYPYWAHHVEAKHGDSSLSLPERFPDLFHWDGPLGEWANNTSNYKQNYNNLWNISKPTELIVSGFSHTDERRYWNCSVILFAVGRNYIREAFRQAVQFTSSQRVDWDANSINTNICGSQPYPLVYLYTNVSTIPTDILTELSITESQYFAAFHGVYLLPHTEEFRGMIPSDEEAARAFLNTGEDKYQIKPSIMWERVSAYMHPPPTRYAMQVDTEIYPCAIATEGRYFHRYWIYVLFWC